MLDDLKLIHERDGQDALGVAAKQWLQLKQSYDTEYKPAGVIENVVVSGMGGSALAAVIVASWPGLSKPYEIVRNYNLPPYVNEKTLLVASSYSGNTEETLEALAEAEKRGAQIVIVCSDGQLAEIARQKNYPLYEIPSGLQPRMATFYNFAGLIKVFEAAGVVENGSTKELQEAADWLGKESEGLVATVPTAKNPAKKIALELVGSSIVIYSGPKFFPAAYKWKINFNENAKNIAWCNFLPEFNHNEILGWVSHPVDKPYKVIDIRSSLEHPRTQARFSITEKLLSGKRPAPEIITPEGGSLIKQLLWTIQLGDFVSIYLAILNGLDPTPVELIEKLKGELKNI